MWLDILKSRLVQTLLLLAALAAMTYMYHNERKLRTADSKAYEAQIESVEKDKKDAIDAANRNAEMLKLAEQERKLADEATKAAYVAAETARNDAMYLRGQLKRAGKTNPAFGHCLDLALPDELRTWSGKNPNSETNRISKDKNP